MRKNKTVWAIGIFLLLVIAGVSTAASLGVFTTPENKVSLAPEKDQVKDFIETGFGTKLADVSLSDPDVKTMIAEEYSDYASDDLIAKWQNDPEDAPGKRDADTPTGIQVNSVSKTGNDTYEVKGSIVFNSSSASTSIPVELTVEQKPGADATGTLTNKWVITGYSQQKIVMNATTTSSSTNNVQTGSTQTIDGFTATVRYTGNDTWNYLITGELQTPCYTPKASVSVAADSPEHAYLTLNIISPAKGVMCSMVVQNIHLTGTYEASANAAFSFIVSRDGTPSGGSSDGQASGSIRLENMSPVQGSVGAVVTLTGKGFSDAKWVDFGAGVIPPDKVHIVDDTKIIFSIPSTLAVPCQFSQVHCMIALAPLQPGTYKVNVSDGQGDTSNSVSFNLKN